MADGRGDGRRTFIGVAVGQYDDESLNLQSAAADVEKIARWFVEECGLYHDRAVPQLSASPTAGEIQTTLADFLGALEPDDVVVIWLACHGELSGSRSHLFGRDTPASNFAGRSVPAETLGEIIGQSAPHNVLVVIDACVAGRLASEVQRAAEDESDGQNTRDPHRRQANLVLASSYGRDPAHDGEFAAAFLRVVNDEAWTGTTSPWTSGDRLIEGLNAELRSLGTPQVADLRAWGPNAARLIPNPNHEARRLGGLIGDEEFRTHFDPASRGVRPSEGGSYFTGRRDELAQIVEWLHGPADSSVLVITGQPGSGKSALLSRVVVLSDPAHRPGPTELAALEPATVPEPNTIDGVIWCHNKTAKQVIAELGAVSGGTAKTVDDLINLAGERPLTVAIDALDESIGDHATELAGRVLHRLVEGAPKVRLLIATREQAVHGSTRIGLPDLLAPAELLDLDRAPRRVEDMTDYVSALLADNPGFDASERPIEEVAAEIVEAADGSFLVAALVARSPSVDRPGSGFPSEVGDALAEYIDRLPNPTLARSALRPLAWAHGAGLPWAPWWPELATSLAVAAGDGLDDPIGDADIARLLDDAGDLVVESIDGERPVYRVFHEALAEHLRADLDSMTAHGSFVEVLEARRDHHDWHSVDGYLLRALPTHLRGAGRIDELVSVLVDPTWDRAMRERNRDALASIDDAVAAIDLLIDAGPPTSLQAVPLCLGFSRATTTTAPLVIEGLALAGQRARAEAMAANLTVTPDRMLAYRLLAAVAADEGDPARARECVDEVDRSLGTMPAPHLAMAHYWRAAAALDAGLDDRALSAVQDAVEAAVANIGDGWDTPNGIFWAGMAARLVGDGASRQALVTKLHELDPPMLGRNQALQAAAVLGETDLLGRYWKRALQGSRYPATLVREGNLALALADAGMTAELAALVELVDRSGGPAGEADSNKRWAWALALSGDLSKSIEALAHIGDPVEQSKAIARLARIAEREGETPALEALASRIRELPAGHDARVEARLINALWRTGHREEALAWVERYLVSQHRLRPMEDPRDGGVAPSPPGFGLVKVGRREMVSSIIPVADEQRVTRVAEVAASDPATARRLAEEIAIPAYRAQALAAIAANEIGDDAVTTWLRALAEARAAGLAPVRALLDQGYDLLRRAGLADEADGLQTEVERVDALWEIENFSEQYGALRQTMLAGEARTRRLDALMLGPRLLAQSRTWAAADVSAAWQADDDGKRLFALAMIEAQPELTSDEILHEAIRRSRSAYEQYVALEAALACARRGLLSPVVRSAINAELEDEPRADGTRSGIGADSDRLHVIALIELADEPKRGENRASG